MASNDYLDFIGSQRPYFHKFIFSKHCTVLYCTVMYCTVMLQGEHLNAKLFLFCTRGRELERSIVREAHVCRAKMQFEKLLQRFSKRRINPGLHYAITKPYNCQTMPFYFLGLSFIGFDPKKLFFLFRQHAEDKSLGQQRYLATRPLNTAWKEEKWQRLK